MPVPTPITDLQATAGYGMVRATWNPPTNWRTQSLLSYTATVQLSVFPFTVLGTVTNAPLAGGIDPMAECVFGKLTNGTAVTVSVVATNGSGNSSVVTSAAVTPTQMPGQLPNVITAIMGELAWMCANLVLAPCPRMRFGKKYVPETHDAPYVHFIPGRAEIQGSTHLGSGAPGSPLQLWEKRQRVTAECWGFQLPTTDTSQDYISSYGVAEQLMNNVAAACHDQTFGSGLAIVDEYNPIQDNETRGVGMSLEFSVFMPITEIPVPPSDVATIDDLDQTNDI